MKFIALIYNDSSLLAEMPTDQFNATMRDCISHADHLRHEGRLLDSQLLDNGSSARSIRVRNGRQTITDGPFTETKELLAGFNVIEAENMDEAVQIASKFPWAETGCVEVRPIIDFTTVREKVNQPGLRAAPY
jgi:hypothetical protein